MTARRIPARACASTCPPWRPFGTYDEIAHQLTDGYWAWNGVGRHAFDVAPGGVLTADITALGAEGRQLARWALEAWTSAPASSSGSYPATPTSPSITTRRPAPPAPAGRTPSARAARS